MYATKRRRRNVKSHAKSPIKDPPKSNPSKRHRERLNSELELLASLLPFEQNVVSKLDKLSILRLAVSYLRTKSYFQAVLGERFPLDNHLHRRLHHRIHHSHHLYSDLGFTDSETVLQALSGFLFVVTCDGEVFYASHTVEQYLGFHQSDIIHQSALELIHSEDREQFKYQLNWQQQMTGEAADMTLEQALLPSNSHLLQRCFTVRFRCLLDNASGFITLEICGKIKALVGQNTKSKDVPLALFALCCPFGPLPLADVPSRDYTFKSKHKMDMSPISMDPRGRMVFDYSDQELLQKGGYDLIHPEDLHYFAAAHQELIKTGSSGLIAYRLMTKDFHWIWLQTSSRVIYKNSKPDFILCIHRHLTEDEGRDLVRKRGSEFKLPYPIIDCDPSEFGIVVDEDVSRIRSPRGKKSKSQLRDYLQTGRKRKVPYRDLYSGTPFSTTYNNTVAYYGCSAGSDVKAESIYPYPGSNLAFDANLYRTGYHTLCSTLPGATTDGLGSEMERHYSRYYLEQRQCQLELPYHSTGYYSDLLAQRSSKYSALDVSKPGFGGYGLDLSSGPRGHYDDEISRYETTDFRKYPYIADKSMTGLIDSSGLLPGCIYGAQNPMINPEGLLSCGTMPLIANSQLSLYRADFGTAFDCYSSCVLAKTSNGSNGSVTSGSIHDSCSLLKPGSTFNKYPSTFKKSSPISKSSNTPNSQTMGGLAPYPTEGTYPVSYSPQGGANTSDNLPSCSASWPVSTISSKLPDISSDEAPQLRHQVSVVKQTNLFTSSPAGPKSDKTNLDQNGHMASHGNALGGVATSVIQLSGRNRRCKVDDTSVVNNNNPIGKLSGWHNSSSGTGAGDEGGGGYSCSPVFSNIYASQEKSMHDSSSEGYRSDRNSVYDSTGLYAAHGIVEAPKVACFGESW